MTQTSPTTDQTATNRRDIQLSTSNHINGHVTTRGNLLPPALSSSPSPTLQNFDSSKSLESEKVVQIPQQGVTLRHRLLTTLLPVVLAPLAIAGTLSWSITNQRAFQEIELKLWNDSMLAADLTGGFVDNKSTIPSPANLKTLEMVLEHVNISNSEQVQILIPASKTIISTMTSKGLINQPELLGGEPVLQKAKALLVEMHAHKPNSKEKNSPGRKASYFATRKSLQGLTIIPFVHEEGDFVLSTSFTDNRKWYYISIVPGIDWVSVASIELSELRTASNQQGLIFISISLILGATAAVSILFLARWLSAPLNDLFSTAQQVALGNLDISAQPRGTTETQMLAASFNNLVIRVKGFLQQQEAETKQIQLFADIAASRAHNFQDLESVFNKAVQGAQNILKVERVVIYRFNADWSGYIATESVVQGWSRALAGKIEDACIGEELIKGYRNGRVVPTNNVFEAGFHPDHLKLMERLEIKANLVTPIVSNEKLFGLLIAHHCLEPHAWQQSEINFLSQLAAQVGLTLDRVTFLEQQRTDKEQLQKRALQLLMEVEPVSKGDLTIRVNVTKDEIGTVADSYNTTIGSLRKIVTQVQTAAQQVTATTSTNEVSAKELSAEALRQAKEIAAALEQIQEMSNSIRAVAHSAEQAEAAVRQATQTVEEGNAAMNRTVDGILTIRKTVAQTSKKVKRLGESSQKISKVVNLISTFAEQTNLLALNAAIEAANAGEQGRGFAVVADKVRSLARQSKQATAEIESLVKDIQTETNEVVAAMEAGTEQVVTGTQLVDQTRQSLNKITATSTQISELVSAIASAAVAQSQASESVSQTMSDVAAIAQHNSTEATLVSASFKELLAVATELQASAGQFKVS